jgi:hypothetical protein
VTAAQQEHTNPQNASKKQQLQELQQVMRRWQVADAMERPSQHTMLLADATVTAVEGEVTVRAQVALVVAMIASAAVARCRPRSTRPPQLPWLCSDEGQQERRGEGWKGLERRHSPRFNRRDDEQRAINAMPPRTPSPRHPSTSSNRNQFVVCDASLLSVAWRGLACSKGSTPSLPFKGHAPEERMGKQRGRGATHDERLSTPSLR